MSRRQGLWGDEIMTCAEFQKVLPHIIESGGNPEQEEHLRSCPVCGDLVADLKHIAGPHAPSPGGTASPSLAGHP